MAAAFEPERLYFFDCPLARQHLVSVGFRAASVRSAFRRFRAGSRPRFSPPNPPSTPGGGEASPVHNVYMLPGQCLDDLMPPTESLPTEEAPTDNKLLDVALEFAELRAAPIPYPEKYYIVYLETGWKIKAFECAPGLIGSWTSPSCNMQYIDPEDLEHRELGQGVAVEASSWPPTAIIAASSRVSGLGTYVDQLREWLGPG